MKTNPANIETPPERASEGTRERKPAGLPSIDLLRLHAQMLAVFADRDLEQALFEILKITVALVNAGGAAFFSKTPQGLLPGPQLFSRSLFTMDEDVVPRMRESNLQAIRTQAVHMARMGPSQEFLIISCPISHAENRPAGISAVVFVKEQEREPFVTVVQLIAALVSLQCRWLHAGERAGLAGPHRELLRILSDALKDPNREKGFFRIAEELRKVFRCQEVSLGASLDGERVSLRAISQVARFDVRSEVPQAIQSAMNECFALQKSFAWPGEEGCGLYPSLVLRDTCDTLKSKQVMCLPLVDSGNDRVGVLLLAWDEDGPDMDLALAALREYGELLGNCLLAMEVGSAGLITKMTASLKKMKKSNRRVLLVLLSAALLLLFVPTPYSVKSDCTLKSVVRRFVVPRFDGVLKQVYHEPGAMVSHGDLLAVMDEREIDLEIAALKADHEKSSKMKDMHMAGGKTAESLMSRLEEDRSQLKISALEDRKKHLEIRSPVDGILLSGDLKRVEGSPVAKGQVLFEVAPLEDMLVEVLLSEQDVALVERKAKAEIRLTAYPNRSWEGTVDNIKPKSEIRGGANVFVAEVLLKNEEGILRPGMTGKAWARCGNRPLVWMALHKPWAYLMQWLRM